MPNRISNIDISTSYYSVNSIWNLDQGSGNKYINPKYYRVYLTYLRIYVHVNILGVE